MEKLSDLLEMAKVSDIIATKKEKEDNKIVWALAIIGAIAAVAGIAFAVYKYLTPDYMDDFAANKAENKVLGQFAGLSMVLKSETTLNIFYEPKEGVDVSKLTFSVDGKEITPVKRGQYYILSLKNIKANELGNSKTFTVTDGTNTLSGEYCAMMYCYQVLQAAEGTYADDLVTLVKAFSDYAYTAKSVCQSN